MKTYAVRSDAGTRVWHADDYDHAEEQHLDSFPDEKVREVYAVEHPEDCSCSS